MTTVTPFIYAQNPNTYVSGTATIDSGETATLAIPCGGRSVVWIGVPTIDSANITFTVTDYPGATARTLKAADGSTVTITAGTGGFAIAVPQLTGCYSFTIVTSATQNSARAFDINVVGDSPALALTNSVQQVAGSDFTTVPQAFANVASGANSWTQAHSPITAYTVTGSVLARVFGVVGATQLTSTGGTGTAAIGVAGATGAFLAATTINGTTNFVANAAWVDTTPTLTAEALANSSGWVLCTGNIIITIATNDATAGAITLYCQYIPVSSNGAVVAA